MKLDNLILKCVWKLKEIPQTFPHTYRNLIYVRSNGAKKTVFVYGK